MEKKDSFRVTLWKYWRTGPSMHLVVLRLPHPLPRINVSCVCGCVHVYCVHFSSPTSLLPTLTSSFRPPSPPTLVARISSSDSSSYVITPQRRSKPGTSVHSLVSVLPLSMKHRKMRASLECSRSVLRSVNQSFHQLVNQLSIQSTNQIFNVRDSNNHQYTDS